MQDVLLDELGRGTLAGFVRQRGFVVAPQLFAGLWSDILDLQKRQLPPARMTGVLTSTAFWEHRQLTDVLDDLLGPDFVVARVHLGVGAADLLATMHTRAGLFSESGLPHVPVFSVTIFVPLVAASAHARSDEDADGSGVTHSLVPGDAMVLDSRTHASLVAQSTPTPGLLVTFTRAWFREPRSGAASPPIELSLYEWLKLPAPVRLRLRWRFDRYMRHRHLQFAYQLTNRLPRPIGAPINRKLRGWASSY